MSLDNQIRSALDERQRDAPGVMTVSDLLARVGATDLESPEPVRTRRWTGVAAATALAAAILGVVVVDRRPAAPRPPVATRETIPATTIPARSSWPTVGTYFRPSSLPDGYRLLSFSETASDPTETTLARSLYATVDGRRLTLRIDPDATEWTSSSHSADIDGGTIRWGLITIDRPNLVTFQIARGRTLISGEITIDDPTDEMLAALGASVDLDPHGIPVINDPDYRFLTSAPTGLSDAVATWTAIYGQPAHDIGMYPTLFLTATRHRDPIDINLTVGITADTQSIDGRTIYGGRFFGPTTWFPDDHLVITASGTIGDINGDRMTAEVDLLAHLQPIDDATLADDIANISDAADDLTATTVRFEGEAWIEIYGPTDDPFGLCLTIDRHRACDLATQRHNQYRNGVVDTTSTNLLVDGTWYTIGTTRDDQPSLPTTVVRFTTTTVGTSTWYIAELAANATRWQPPGGYNALRPTRAGT